MELEWGNKIIEAIRQLDGQDNAILLVRHAERPSFEGMPVEQWNSVLLTERGVEQAKSFGKAVSIDGAVKTLRVHHWGLQRCVMTADAISIGASEAGSQVHGPTPIPLKSPIRDNKEYRKAVSGVAWDAFVNSWLQEKSPRYGMEPADQYAREILRSLRNEKLSSPRGATIIATHDIHIIPLVNYIFHAKNPWIDYLDGIALKVYPEKITVSFGGAIQDLRPEELLEGVDSLQSYYNARDGI